MNPGFTNDVLNHFSGFTADFQSLDELQFLLEPFNDFMHEFGRPSGRRLTSSSLISRAQGFWNGDPVDFVFRLEEFIFQWAVNNGVFLYLSPDHDFYSDYEWFVVDNVNQFIHPVLTYLTRQFRLRA